MHACVSTRKKQRNRAEHLKPWPILITKDSIPETILPPVKLRNVVLKSKPFDKANTKMAFQQKTLHSSTRKVEKGFDIPWYTIPPPPRSQGKQDIIFKVRKTRQCIATGLRFLESEFSKTLRTTHNCWWCRSGEKSQGFEWKRTPETWCGLNSCKLFPSLRLGASILVLVRT